MTLWVGKLVRSQWYEKMFVIESPFEASIKRFNEILFVGSDEESSTGKPQWSRECLKGCLEGLEVFIFRNAPTLPKIAEDRGRLETKNHGEHRERFRQEGIEEQ